MKKSTLVFTLLCAFTPSILLAAPRYTVEPIDFSEASELPVLLSSARSINHRGVVVGAAGVGPLAAEGNYAFLARPPEPAEFLTPPLSSAIAHDINDRGVAVGATVDGAVLWDKFGEMMYIALNDATTSRMSAAAINKRGQVVGNCDECGAFGFFQAWLWDANDGIRQLLIGSAYVKATDINNGGLVVGYREELQNVDPIIPFVLDTKTGVLSDIDTNGNGFARAINDRDVVVGEFVEAGTGSSLNTAFVWDADIGLMELPFLDGTDSARPWAINNRGSIVGISILVGAQGAMATIWYEGSPFDLNSLLDNPDGWHLEHAYGINDKGQIVGVGDFNGVNTAYLLTPVKGNQ